MKTPSRFVVGARVLCGYFSGQCLYLVLKSTVFLVVEMAPSFQMLGI